MEHGVGERVVEGDRVREEQEDEDGDIEPDFVTEGEVVGVEQWDPLLLSLGVGVTLLH